MDDETDEILPSPTEGDPKDRSNTAALQVFLRRERLYRQQVAERYDGRAHPWAWD